MMAWIEIYRPIAEKVFGAWVLMMIVTAATSFNYNSAALTTLALAFFAYLMMIKTDIARIDQKLDDHIEGVGQGATRKKR